MKLELKPEQKLSILLVDDEADIRETLRMFLEMMELFDFIVEAADGSEATRKCQNQEFDIIITDLLMPNVRGIEFIQNFKAQQSRKKKDDITPIIILSANVTGEEVTKAIHFGVKNVITKPCTAEEFISKVTEVLMKYKRNKIRVLKD
ncbi:MAG: response regulator transcription factor [Halobacteriovoraceae bacterium]|nr:response regulator transcription factor [Halobacteriovoraceae bacterium]